MMLIFDFSIPFSHPCLDGHFPGNPVVPGVIILDEVMQGIASVYPSARIKNISAVKFLNPLKPNILVHVHVTKRNEEVTNFTCETSECLIAKGSLRLQGAQL